MGPVSRPAQPVVARRPRAYDAGMARLIRMDHTGHTTLAEWSAADDSSVEVAVAAFRAELEAGYYAVVTAGEGAAEQVRVLPVDS